MKAGQKAKKAEQSISETFEEMQDFFIFPHEFLCLACNASDRLELLQHMYRPNFKLRKTEICNI
jgi:hypothetical protein